MSIDHQRFKEQGFLILRNLIDPTTLESLRANIEHMVDRRRDLALQRRLPTDPACGTWTASGQPRLQLDMDSDADSIGVIEFLASDHCLEVCRQLIDAEHIVPHNFSCICSSESHDAGPARWHRDIGVGDPAPLEGMIANMQHHGPSYLQWNIALYEDNVFWVVPGSHHRSNTEAENRHLAANSSVPLPGSIPVELGPGDGVVYTHLLLHWGSNYTRKLRRTIHPGFRPFGYTAMPNVHWRHWEPGFYHYLQPEIRERFETWDRLFFTELDLFTQLFRATIDRCSDTFTQYFEQVHPSSQGRAVSLAMLHRINLKLQRFLSGEAPASDLWGNGRDFTYLGSHFTSEDGIVLKRRFSELDRLLQVPVARETPSFQGDTSPYEPNKMPDEIALESFIASWA